MRRQVAGLLALAVLTFSVLEFCFASVYNSGFFGKDAFILYWVAFGLMAAAYEIDVRPSRTRTSPGSRR